MHISDSVIRKLQVFASSCLWNSLLWGSSEKKMQLLHGYLMHSTKEYSHRTVPLCITIDWSSYWHLPWFPLFWSAWRKLRKGLPGWDCVDLKNKRPRIKAGSTQAFCCLLALCLKREGRSSWRAGEALAYHVSWKTCLRWVLHWEHTASDKMLGSLSFHTVSAGEYPSSSWEEA